MRRKFAFSITILLIVFIPAYSGQASTYTLGPGDELLIRVENHPDLTLELVVGPDGYISYPMVGAFKVTGLTITEVKEQLTDMLQPHIPNLWVTVVLLKARPINIQVLGEVKTPGKYSVQQGTTVMQVLAQAGGLTEKADREHIALNRSTGVVGINMKAIAAGDLSGDVVLQDGDTIIVNKGVIRVAVLGEVVKPGVYEILPGSRLMDALAQAGGPTISASVKRISVYQGVDLDKPNPSGEKLFQTTFEQNPPMQEGYIIVVARNHFWDISFVVSILTALGLIKTLIGL
jgi:protein involved in polysaccharide export with SLBB domain